MVAEFIEKNMRFVLVVPVAIYISYLKHLGSSINYAMAVVTSYPMHVHLKVSQFMQFGKQLRRRSRDILKRTFV